MAHIKMDAVLRRLKLRTTYWDFFHAAFAGILCLTSYTHLFWRWSPWLAPRVTIVAVDLYLGIFLFLAALSVPRPLPARQVALMTVPSLFLVLIMSFASYYIAEGNIERPTSGKDVEHLCEPWDAAYFSTVTITTLGYGDWAPSETGGRKIVIYELLSGAMLLLFLVPLLASRLSLLDEPVGSLTTIGISRLKDGGWQMLVPRQALKTLKKSETLTLVVHADGSVTTAGS